MSSYVAIPTHSNFSASMTPRSGFLGTLKAKITRKNSNSSNSTLSRSSTSTSSGSKTANPFRQPVPAAAALPVTLNRNAPSPLPIISNDPPPAYSPRTAAAPIPEASSARSSLSIDDRYSFLRSFDTVFLIDDSGSMVGRSWRETKDALAAIAPICTSYDADGIDMYFLNTKDNPFFRN